MNSLFEQIDLSKPDQVIRMVFCVHYLKLARAPWHIQWAKSKDNYVRANHMVTLLHQVNSGSVRKLVKDITGLSGEEMNKAVNAVVSPRLVGQSIEALFPYLEPLEPVVSDLLMELLFLVDSDNWNVERKLLEKLDPSLGYHASEDLLLPEEIYLKSMESFEDKLGPELLKHYALVLRGEHMFKVQNVDDFQKKKVWSCSDIAGNTNLLGFVRAANLPSSQLKSFFDSWLEKDCIYLKKEKIHISADMLAFLTPGNHFLNELVSRAFSACQSRTSVDEDQRADRYRHWAKEWVLWHEWGHLQEPIRILQPGHESDKWIWFYSLNELNADVHALNMFQMHGSESMKDYLIANFIFRSGIGTSNKDPNEPVQVNEDLFILWALMSEQPAEAVFTDINSMLQLFQHSDKQKIRSWVANQHRYLEEEILARMETLDF